jgi:hypothetical protein
MHYQKCQIFVTETPRDIWHPEPNLAGYETVHYKARIIGANGVRVCM